MSLSCFPERSTVTAELHYLLSAERIFRKPFSRKYQKSLRTSKVYRSFLFLFHSFSVNATHFDAICVHVLLLREDVKKTL